MWSNKKYVNILINILLFMMAMNFMHYGQLFLPIICLILFIDNNFKIKLNNTKIFVVLCLFAINFCLFSYKLGFYCVMGFCLPMAYYIGSNLKNKNEESIKNVIYIIAFGMATHLVLNMLMELSFWYDDLSYMFNKPSHYDFWIYNTELLKGNEEPWKVARIRTTGTAMNFIPLISICFYIIKYEKNRFLKVIGMILFILSFVYSFALGRRTTFILLAISLMLCFLLDIKSNKLKKINFKIVFIVICCFVCFVVIYLTNIFGIKDFINELSIVSRLIDKGLNSERISIFIQCLKLMPKHLFGGQEISKIIGVQVHDLWGDVYDYAGIVPYILLIMYSLFIFKNNMTILKSKNTPSIRNMLLVLFVICILQMCLEPIITGASLFLICFVLMESIKENY